MVEGELGQIVYGEPLCLCCIVAGNDLVFLLAHERHEGYGHHTFPWVAVYCGERLQLFDIDILYAGLLLQFPQGTLFGGLVYLHETTRESPAALVWFNAAVDEKKVEFSSVEAEHDAVGSHGGMGIFISIHIIYCLLGFAD